MATQRGVATCYPPAEQLPKHAQNGLHLAVRSLITSPVSVRM